MKKNWLGIYSDRIFIFVIAIAMIVASVREIYMAKKFNSQANYFHLYQELNQNYSILYRNYFAFEAEFKQIKTEESSIYSNNALFYVLNSLNKIEEMERLVHSLSENFVRAKLIDFTSIKGNYKKIKINLEDSKIQKPVIQLLSVNTFNSMQQIGDEIDLLADELKNFQNFEYNKSFVFTIALLIISLFLLFLFIRVHERRLSLARKLLKLNLETLNLGNRIMQNNVVSIPILQQILELSVDLSSKLEALKSTMIFLTKGDPLSAEKIFPFDKKSYLGVSFYTLSKAYQKREKKLKEESILFNNRIKRNDALSDLEREMRENASSDMLYSIILQKIIKFIGFIQGGFFILRRNERGHEYLNLESSYAYNHERILSKKIELGEGLVGTCAIEQNIVILNDIPDNYIEIGSGLGEKKPNYLAILPIVYREKTVGVMELATFNEITGIHQEYLKEASSIIALFLINRFREEQAENKEIIITNSSLAKKMNYENLLNVNALMSNQLTKIIGVTIFDKFDKLFNYTKSIEQFFPNKLSIGNTNLINILSEEYHAKLFSLEQNELLNVEILDSENENLKWFLVKNKNRDDINSILFVCKL